MDDKYVIGATRNLTTRNELNRNKHDKDLEADTEHIEHLEKEGSPPGKTKQASIKFQRHWKRFWCCYLIASIIFLAIFLPVFFLVAIPAIAQRIVDGTDLPLHAASLLDPKPDKVSFSLHTSLKVPAGLQIHIDPLKLSAFRRDVTPIDPYLAVPVPAYDLKGTTQIEVTRNDTNILNQQEFVQTLTDAVYNKRFIMSAKGKTLGHLGALKTPLKLNKDLDLAGLDKFRGFSIDSARLLVPKAEDGSNLAGVATLPNHSVFTLALGNMTVNLKSQDLVLGQATILNVVLKPGNNTVSLRGDLDIDKILNNISDIVAAQRDALQDGELELTATGNSTTYNGVHIPYYETILRGLDLTARVPIMKIFFGTLEGMMGGSDFDDALERFRDALGNS
ncbi:hypothetical protein PHISCL_06839 [Aspergillus sclerotialis]|uniref:Uncharacterized protein n=1 Tax=Aspergillus sclerotialis TaxID=2070753 RepID=A0A3A2ZDY8_9EURO|nr:hypothetical protein PHISCL_06839 [Aspergillus sclerotialis]